MHNQFYDPATGETYTWEFNHNAVEASPRTRAIEHLLPTAAGWQQVTSVRQQGDMAPEVHRLTGTAFSASQHEAFMRFWRICATRTIHFLPCNGGSYEAVIRAYEPTRRRVVGAARGDGLHVWDYTIEMEIVGPVIIDVAPTIAVLAPGADATLGGTVMVTASAADNVAVVSVAFLVDGVQIATDTTSPYSTSWDTASVDDGTYTITATVTDSSGLATTSAPVTVTVDNSLAPPPPSGPNVLYTEGRRFKLTANGSVFAMRGQNVHGAGFVFGQSNFDSIAANGFNTQRLCLQWDNIEPTEGNFSAVELGYAQAAIDRAAAVGINTVIEVLISTPRWDAAAAVVPAWARTSTRPSTPVAPWNTASIFDCLVSNGEGYIRKLVQTFGAQAYVSGFMLGNEPDHLPASVVQSGLNRMLNWARSEPNSAGKLWYVTNAYSSQSAAAAFNDWDAIEDWTNVVLQLHTYYAPNLASDDGWSTSNGMRKSSTGTYWNGGPEATSYSSANKAALRLHFASWNALSVAKGVPWILGEVGVQYNKSTAGVRDAWCRDVVEAAELEGCAGIMWWIYGVNSTQDPWAAAPSSVWRPEVLHLAGFTPT